MDILGQELIISNIAAAIQNDPKLEKKFKSDPEAVQNQFGLTGIAKKKFVKRVNATIEKLTQMEVHISQSTEEVSKLDPEAMEKSGHNFGQLPRPPNPTGACMGTTACRACTYPATATFGSSGCRGSRGTAASIGTAGSVASFAGRTTNLTRSGSLGTAACMIRSNQFATTATLASSGGTTTNLTTPRPFGTAASLGLRPLIPFRPVGSTATFGNTRITARPFTMGSSFCLTGRPYATAASAGTIGRSPKGCFSGQACITRPCLAAPVPRPPACFATAFTTVGTLASGCQVTTGCSVPSGGNGGQPGHPIGENGGPTEYAKAKATVSLKSIMYAGDPVGDNFELRIQVGKSEPPFTWKGKMTPRKRKAINKEVFDGTFTYEVSTDSIGLPLTITLKEIDRIDRLHDETVLTALINLPLEPAEGEVTKQTVELELTEIDEKPGDVPSVGKFSFNFWCGQVK